MSEAQEKPIGVRQVWDDRIEIRFAGTPGSTPTTYQFSPKMPKGCVHPLVTPAGHVISTFQPSDHVWHRGIWFTIKFINGTNFWEENEEKIGVQRSKEQPRVELIAEDAVRVTHLLEWKSEPTGKVFDEKRVLTFRAALPGVRSVDWSTELKAEQDLVLERTPYTTWGGYGGMSFRASRESHNAKFMLPAPGSAEGATADKRVGEKGDWCVLSAQMDGGKDEWISVGMIDHPGNVRSPSPWYGHTDKMRFFNAAFLFHEPMKVKKGEVLKFKYRIYWRDGVWSAEEFGKLAGEFRGS